jgi:ABC-2 type transport system ATP-binding protein
MADLAIQTSGLTKRYRSHLGMRSGPVLDGLDLSIRECEVFGFLGKNGAGKTTTIKILCGLVRQTQGEASIFGENVRQKSARCAIGYLPESPYFYEYLTPRETVEFYTRLDGLSPKERKNRWGVLAELLELEEIADQRVRDFSKGMRQRLGFAVALASDPKLLILDEPMSGLDPMGRHMVRDLITRLRDERKTVFFSSHILGDVEQICDRVGMLIDGKLHKEGTLANLLTRETNRVDVVAAGVSDELVQRLGENAVLAHATEAGHRFGFAHHDAADAAIQAIYAEGGRILEMNPIKETLEDYFVRQQSESRS